MNKIETIKIGDIEVPVEYLKQTTVNVNGDDYIRLQQENKQLKDNWNKLKEYFTNITNYYPIDNNPLCEILIMTYEDINNKMEELERGKE